MRDGRVILYVEDDDAAFFLATIVLREQAPEIQLLRACDGEQALAMLRRGRPYEDTPRPELILLDLNLPKKSGFEVLADLKESDSLRSIPVVIFSTSESATDRSTSRALGADDYISKPSSLDSFIELVKRACSLSVEAPGPESKT